jgi:radical SAM protein with 4Fe4S-binding SPASM domain
MRTSERWNYLKQSPRMTRDILINGHYDFKFDLMPVHTKRMTWARRTNLIRSGANLIHLRPSPWSWPNHMQIELTNYCNLRCKVCPTGIGKLKRPPKDMDPAMFERLLSEVGPYLLTASLWGWGEPLLHPWLADILRISQDRGVATLLSTNGQNLDDDKVLQALLDYPPTYLIVCLDGLTDETNSVFRVGARLEPALKGVRCLARMKREKGQTLPILHFRYIVMKHNEQEVPRLPGFAEENHFDMLSIRTLSIIDAPEDAHHELIPDNENLRAYGYKDSQRVNRKDFICENAFTFPTVFADGTVVACDQDYNAQQAYGSIANGVPFADIWWSQKAAGIRKTIRDNPETFSFCRNCPFADRPISTCSIEYFYFNQVLREGNVPNVVEKRPGVTGWFTDKTG